MLGHAVFQIDPTPSNHPAADACALCAAPLSTVGSVRARLLGVERMYCCHGCASLARLQGDIQGVVAKTPISPTPEHLQDGDRANAAEPASAYAHFDDLSVQRNLVHRYADGSLEAGLAVHGVHCAACVTIIGAALTPLAGVTEVAVDVTRERARVRWDPERIGLSAILETFERAGYPAAPEHSLHALRARSAQARSALKRLGVAALAMMQVMMFALPAYVSGDGVAPEQIQLLRWASLVITLPAMLYSARPFFAGAWRDLSAHRLGMDVPAALGLAIAFAASGWATFGGDGDTYYDSITMFVFFVLAGRYFEMRARQGALSAAEALTSGKSLFCTRLKGHSPASETQVVPLATLAPGDYVRVNGGESFPADGRIVRGVTTASEALLTGEATPVIKRVGAVVFAGTLNQSEPVDMVVESAGNATRLAGIVRQLEAALESKPRVALIADRFAGWFVLALLAITAITSALWLAFDPARALAVTVAVLVVSCPCALSLATPAALSAATSALARRGVLVFRGHALETLARATHVVFDKTGTLTEGNLTLRRIIVLGDKSEQECLSIAVALERDVQHPAAQALLRAAGSAGVIPVAARQEYIAGQGVGGVIDGHVYRLGRPEYVASLHGGCLPADIDVDETTSLVALGDERGGLAWFSLSDKLRPRAIALMRELEHTGVAVSLYSGDRPEAVSHVADALGIHDWRASMRPEDKRDAIQALQEAGAVVIMVGDGANDSPALAQAQASVALATGAAIAQSGADVVLVGQDLAPVALTVRTARRALRIIRQNLAWAAAYNIVCIPLAASGWISPLFAGLGMSASSLFVVFNALRLTQTHIGRKDS